MASDSTIGSMSQSMVMEGSFDRDRWEKMEQSERVDRDRAEVIKSMERIVHLLG